jgi:hypothetical protein
MAGAAKSTVVQRPDETVMLEATIALRSLPLQMEGAIPQSSILSGLATPSGR